MYVHGLSMVCTALQLNVAEHKRHNTLQIISGEIVTVIKAKIIKCGRDAGVKIGNLRGKNHCIKDKVS